MVKCILVAAILAQSTLSLAGVIGVGSRNAKEDIKIESDHLQ